MIFSAELTLTVSTSCRMRASSHSLMWVDALSHRGSPHLQCAVQPERCSDAVLQSGPAFLSVRQPSFTTALSWAV